MPHIPPQTVKKFADEYDKYIGFYLGIFNSCVAYVDETGITHLLPIDPDIEVATGEIVYSGEISPSIIIYRNTGQGKDYAVGRQANRERTSQRDRDYYVASPLRDLGSAWNRHFQYSDDGELRSVSPYGVIVDMTSAFLEKVELTLQKKVTKCVVTYPIQFLQPQLDDLKRIFERRLGFNEGDTVHFIDEASALSLDYIFQRRGREYQNETYHTLIYDFGKETVELALNRVAVEDNRLTIAPLIIDSLPFGEDNVTELVIQWIVDFCTSELKKRIEAEARVNIPFIKKDHRVPDTAHRELALAMDQNSQLLYEAANGIQIGVTTYTEAVRNLNALCYVAGTSSRPQRLDTVFSPVNVRLTRNEFNELIRPPLAETLETVDRLIQEVNAVPDVFVIAGEAATIPFFKTFIQEHFGWNYPGHPLEIYLAPNAEELKAKGAARYGQHLVPLEETPTTHYTLNLP